MNYNGCIVWRVPRSLNFKDPLCRFRSRRGIVAAAKIKKKCPHPTPHSFPESVRSPSFSCILKKVVEFQYALNNMVTTDGHKKR